MRVRGSGAVSGSGPGMRPSSGRVSGHAAEFRTSSGLAGEFRTGMYVYIHTYIYIKRNVSVNAGGSARALPRRPAPISPIGASRVILVGCQRGRSGLRSFLPTSQCFCYVFFRRESVSCMIILSLFAFFLMICCCSFLILVLGSDRRTSVFGRWKC